MPRPPAVTLEDLVLAYEDGLTSAQLAEELQCSAQAVYRAKRRHGLQEAPRTAAERLALLERCGWSQEDAEAQVGVTAIGKTAGVGEAE